MNTIVLKVKNPSHISYILEFLQKLNIVEEIISHGNSGRKKYNNLPIEWPSTTVKRDELAGIWKNKEITLEKLRTKAWKRN